MSAIECKRSEDALALRPPPHQPAESVLADPRPARDRPVASPASAAAAIVAGLLMVLALALVVALVRPFIPAAVTPADAPPGEFSAARAMPHLQVIAGEPHPIGSPANQRVRDYLLTQLTALGLQPQVQRTTGFRPASGMIAPVENVLVHLPGTAPSRAVLIVGHYDSVVGAPGAGDNGLAVAAMLETVRALRAGPPLRNDLIFLFDDGEELMVGAGAFIEQHPWARDVGVVFDFDADTPTGPTVLLWTTRHDGWVVDEVARAAPGLLAISADTPALRAWGDNNQDLHVFAEAGFTGAHFNTVGGSITYHTPRDSLTAVDPRSLQDRGNVILLMARHFGDLPIGATVAEDTSFASLFGWIILRYPLAWALPLALVAGLAVAASLALGRWRRRLTGRGLALGLVAVLLGVVSTALAAHLAWQAILAAHPESLTFAERDFYGRGVAMTGLYALTAALALALWPWLDRRIGTLNLAAATLVWAAVLAVYFAIVQPGASVAATWPALAGSLALVALVIVPAIPDRRPNVAHLAALVLGMPVAIGLIGLVLVMVVIDNYAAGPALPVALLVLLLGLLAPQVAVVAAAGRRWLTVAAALLGVGLLSLAAINGGLDPTRPRPESLAYLLDPAGGVAYWLTLDPAPGTWTSQILIDDATRRTAEELVGTASQNRFLTSRAPVMPLPAPELIVLGQERQGDEWTLRLRLSSPRGAYRAFLWPGAGVRLLAAGVAGQPLRPLGSQEVRVDGLPAAGQELTLRLQAAGPIQLNLVDQSAGLPDLASLGLPPRPATTMSLPGPEIAQGDPTLVRRSITLKP